MRREITPGPVTVVVYHGSVKVAERTYQSAKTAELALWGSPKWLMRPVRTMLFGRMPRALE